LQRVLLDLSALILIRQANLLRRLSIDIKNGRFAVAQYGLNRLRRNPRWRGWVERNDHRLRVRPETAPEHELFHQLMRSHGSIECNPMISDDDLMAITIARIRGFPLVLRDKAAEQLATSLGVRCIQASDFIKDVRA